MTKHLTQRIIIVSLSLLSLNCSLTHHQTTEDLQRAFVEMRFGAFIHFGIRTFTGGQWGKANQDVTKFNPANLDCNQWAAAFTAAKMHYAILTTKHHDGFCLWDSKYTENDVASSPWKNGQGDMVREFVDAFRAHGLEPMLYYSVWDNTKGIGNSTITADDLEFIKGQITELLTNYGPIKMLFIDGWSWKMGHKSVPYDQIRKLVKELQPGCLLVDNTHLRCLYDNDLVHYESGSAYPSNNTLPAIFSLLINNNSGNGWFWDNRVPTAELLSVNQIVNDNLKILELQWCSFILNCPPNPDGRIDDNIVARLAEVGQTWSPDPTRPPLPAQAPQIECPITPASAQATSGDAAYAIDGLNDRYYYSVWQTTTPLPQFITIDLGQEYDDVSILYYVPKYQPYINPLTEGSIKKYKVSLSTDNRNFSEVAGGEWNGDITMKVVTFPPSRARYLQLEAVTAVDDFAAATEIAIGRGKNPSIIK
jgi:alpha-L-fucosidase